ncbi:MAG TPA: ribosome-associated translation inhibitor RaiA [Streptosporangiaceae bacterium]|nr:ribosome-associated translation inhibitor RaiA [Streptosporangiaceae bacterium]
MDVIVKGRHTDVNDRFRRHVDNKLAKIEKLDQKVIRVDVEVSQERNPRQADRRERVELTIRSRGPVIRAEAAADDRYGALDLALGKLESRLRRTCDRRKVHYGTRAPAKLATMPSLAADEILPEEPARRARGNDRSLDRARREQRAATGSGDSGNPGRAARGRSNGRVADDDARPADDEQIVPIPMEGNGPIVVREKFHKAEPMSIDQALFEMELVGHDFFLFRDTDGGRPSVVYRRRGWDYGVIRLVED